MVQWQGYRTKWSFDGDYQKIPSYSYGDFLEIRELALKTKIIELGRFSTKPLGWERGSDLFWGFSSESLRPLESWGSFSRGSAFLLERPPRTLGQKMVRAPYVSSILWDVQSPHPHCPQFSENSESANFHGLQCSSMVFNALQCSSMLFNALQCSAMVFNALQWSSIPWCLNRSIDVPILVGWGHFNGCKDRRQSDALPGKGTEAIFRCGSTIQIYMNHQESMSIL